jgi:hypothetical protein
MVIIHQLVAETSMYHRRQGFPHHYSRIATGMNFDAISVVDSIKWALLPQNRQA